jgi:hypothetical protein
MLMVKLAVKIYNKTHRLSFSVEKINKTGMKRPMNMQTLYNLIKNKRNVYEL